MSPLVESVKMVPVEAVVPEDLDLVLRSRGLSRRRLAAEALSLLAIHLFQTRMLSLGQAARLAGLTKWDFIDLLDRHGIPVVDYSEAELDAERESLLALEEALAA